VHAWNDAAVPDTIAERLRTAFDSADLTLLGTLLAGDVRWGGEEDTEDTCHSRADVLRWYTRLRNRGVRARVAEVLELGDAVVLELALTGREDDPQDELRARLFQVFRIGDGLVVDIRGFPERADALASAGGS
jgi:ketosteroid isomerase-like protein